MNIHILLCSVYALVNSSVMFGTSIKIFVVRELLHSSKIMVPLFPSSLHCYNFILIFETIEYVGFLIKIPGKPGKYLDFQSYAL